MLGRQQLPFLNRHVPKRRPAHSTERLGKMRPTISLSSLFKPIPRYQFSYRSHTRCFVLPHDNNCRRKVDLKHKAYDLGSSPLQILHTFGIQLLVQLASLCPSPRHP
ncbi:hypothetical protein BC567DRAFT_246825, partial [Phyllosticta citribraziliensis]